MGSEWRTVRLGELANEITVGHVGSMPTYVDDGIPFLRSQNVDRLRINDSDIKTIDSVSHDRLRKSTLHPGDVVIVRTGRPGACAVIPPSLPVANCSDLVIVRCGPALDPWFLAYYINSAAVHGVSSQIVGAVQQHFNIGSARDLTIRLPDLATQREVVEILRALDDKIELNRCMSQTLESIARALFKSWFVDFDPVRAKAEGRDPGLPTQVADLFPDTFEDTDQGAIPRSWRDSTVGEEFHVTMGQSPPGETYNEAPLGLPFYQGRADFGVRFPSRRVYCTAPTRFARPGDTLVCVRAPVGDTNLAVEDCAIGRGLAAVRHKSGASSYTFLAMRSLSDSFEAFESEGTVFGSINKQGFGAMRVTSPSIPVVLTFEQLVWPIDAQVQGAHSQATLLAEIRDSLLPAMMSGQGGPVAARGDMDR